MTEQEIKDGAPNGATHYLGLGGDSITYLSKSHDDWIFHYKGEWFLYNGSFGYDGVKPL